MTAWRREGDSNPRDPFGPNGFQDRRFQPLTHPSAFQFNWQRAEVPNSSRALESAVQRAPERMRIALEKVTSSGVSSAPKPVEFR